MNSSNKSFFFFLLHHCQVGTHPVAVNQFNAASETTLQQALYIGLDSIYWMLRIT